VTFAALYAYGHLLAVAFSLSIALTCAVVVVRVPRTRKDLGLTLTLGYALSAAASALEMWLALRPSLWAGRFYLAVGGAVFFSLVVSFHLQYAGEVLPERRQRAYRMAIAATGGYGLLLLLLLMSGVLDGGHTRIVRLWGAHATMPSMPIWACVLCLLFATANVPLCVELYLREGPSRRPRWLVSSGIWAGPFVVVWDLGICAGINPYLPFGGYLAAILGIEGAAQLVERFRALAPAESSVGGYKLEQRLGSGGMAEVFLAHRPPMGGIDGVVQRVALKRLRTDHVDDPHFVRMFLDEARLLARLSHPNIVQLLDAGRADGQLYLAMELVDGATLQQIFRTANGRGEQISEDVVAEVGVQLCEALEYAHALTGDDGQPLELVHRDISPQNVLVDRHGNVKLSDFGIARSTDRMTETATGLVQGKLTYMAPEQLQGGLYDQRADLYAVGAVLFELLTGERLRLARSDVGLVQEIVEGRSVRLELLSQRSPRFAQVLGDSLAVETHRRPPSAAAMRAQLSSLRRDAQGRDELARWVGFAVDYRRKLDDESLRARAAAPTAVRPNPPARRPRGGHPSR
jgi:tRNA A-37 threonylcarbamoyl transferase component Bud32